MTEVAPNGFSIETLKAADALMVELNKEKTRLLERLAEIDEILDSPIVALIPGAGFLRKKQKRGRPSNEERAQRSAAIAKSKVTIPDAILRVIKKNPGIMSRGILTEVSKIRPVSQRSVSPQISALCKEGKIHARGTVKKYQYYAK